ncbi:MAG: plasmid stabilization protein [Caulobacteraceae bacterium]|nr:plasmid stabilization protein [Caulobacteraceae bacterium]
MAAVTIRNLSEETHRALKARAAEHGRSTEAEIRDILDQVVRPSDRPQLGSLLAQVGREADLTPEDWAAFDDLRDHTPSEPISFE